MDSAHTPRSREAPPAIVSGSIDRWARTSTVAGASASACVSASICAGTNHSTAVSRLKTTSFRRHTGEVGLGDIVANDIVDQRGSST